MDRVDAARLEKLYDEKRRMLQEKGAYTLRQLEDAFHARQTGVYLKDFIFGANDGIVTTFAVVAGAAGANLSSFVVIILGFANLLGDGLSMGLGNFLGDRSDDAYNRGQRQKEFWEVERFPDIERAEVRGLLKDRWGLDGKLLDDMLAHLTSTPQRWVDFMMREELDVVNESAGTKAAAKHGFAMFVDFCLAGFIPLLPFVVPGLHPMAFELSIALSGLTFFVIGSLRARLSPVRWWVAGLEVFLIGSVASGAAYLIGKILERIVQ